MSVLIRDRALSLLSVTRIDRLQRFLYGNAGFNKLDAIEGLADQEWCFDPTVIPLSDSPSPVKEPSFEPDLLAQQTEEDNGRFLSFADYHHAYVTAATTPLHVVDALIPLISRDMPEPTEYSRAWLDLSIDAARAAAIASTERYEAGKPLGILDGIPFGVKADLDVKGFVSTMGMRVDPNYDYFTKPAKESLWPVRKLEAAGAIMLGMMNQHEIGMDTTGCNPSTGTPVNFYNRAYYPGGSSSGAGSALGAGIVPLCVGTDAGGSIRIPTATAGCVAIKPTHNRTVYMNSTMCIVGPMCANINDLTIAYRVMAQPNPACPIGSLFAASTPPAAESKKLLGLCQPWIARAAPDVRALFDRAVDWYVQKQGYTVVPIQLPLLREARTAHGAINLAEAAAHAQARVSAAEARAKGVKWTDLLSAANAVAACVGAQTTATDYLRCAQIRSVIMRHLAHLFSTHGPELLLVSPTLPDGAYAVADGDERLGVSDGDRCLRSMMFVFLSNMSGCPSATVNVGYVQARKGQGSLPVGILATGMWGEEERCLAWAAEGERFLRGEGGGRRRPEGWIDVLARAQGQKHEEA